MNDYYKLMINRRIEIYDYNFACNAVIQCYDKLPCQHSPRLKFITAANLT